MKHSKLFHLLTLIGTFLAAISASKAATKYELSITNGSQMPISPAAIYVKNGTEAVTVVGKMATAGFIQLCQTGNLVTRAAELKSNSSVKSVDQLRGPILPGETMSIEINVADPTTQSIHFETMYGKTKDVCGIGSISSHSLVALKQHVTSEVVQRDSVVVTGAFSEPSLPAGMNYLDSSVCATAMSAVSCLRELSAARSGNTQVRFFSGYFPSLVSALETKYGATDVQTLLFPTSGSIHFKLYLKH